MSLDEVDFYDPATQEDWYPTYDLLREQAPVWQMPDTNIFVLTRFEDIQMVLRRIDIFLRGASARTPGSGGAPKMREIYEAKGWPRNTVLGSNPQDGHRKYRDIVDPFFSMLGAEKRRGLIEGIVDDLLRQFERRGECEYVAEFAIPLPVRVITAMMGFRADDIAKLKVYSEAWVLPFRGGLTEEEEIYAGEKGAEFQHHIYDTMQEKRANPDDSVISYLVNEARFDGRPLDDGEIINMVDHLYIGGNETTTFALTSGLWLLLSHPDQYEDLRVNRSKVRNFVEETLRAESPTMGMVRTAAVDTEVAGVKIPKGSHIHLRYAAANRDPKVFACPADFDIDRSNAYRQMAFSVGETHCPGAGLSRLEQMIANRRDARSAPRPTIRPGQERLHPSPERHLARHETPLPRMGRHIMTIETDILALESKRFAAMIAGDLAALEDLFTPHVVYTHSSGAVDSRESILAGIASKKFDYKAFNPLDQKVFVVGDTALVATTMEMDVVANGVDRHLSTQATVVWVNTAAGWKFAVWHSTPRQH